MTIATPVAHSECFRCRKFLLALSDLDLRFGSVCLSRQYKRQQTKGSQMWPSSALFAYVCAMTVTSSATLRRFSMRAVSQGV